MKVKKTITYLISTSMIASCFYFPIKTDASTSFTTYQVKKGDTLYGVAKKYHLTATQIQKDNHLKSSYLKAGQVLKIQVTTHVTIVKTPIINTLSAITNLNTKSYVISGSGEANATVSLTIKDSKNKSLTYSVKVDKKGKFYTKVNISNLKDGNITLTAYQKNTKGVKSSNTVKSIFKDTVGPVITSSASNISVSNQTSYLINGTTEANLKMMLLVSDGKHAAISASVTSDSNGKFSKSINTKSLNDGKITIIVSTNDKYKNATKKTINVTKTTSVVIPKPPVQTQKIYDLTASERSKWGIYNDGTHPIETTKGINDALIWANQNKYDVFKIPAGTYLISKGTKANDPNAQINMVSNITFELDPKAILQKETNAQEGYQTLNIPINAHDVVIKGGTYMGEKLTHDYTNGAVLWQPNHAYKKGDKVVPPNTVGDNYTHYYVAQNDGTTGDSEPAWLWTKQSTDNTVIWQPYAKSTNEGGYGVVVDGATNVTIDGITALNYTGDGLAIGSKWTYFQDYYAASFESGAVDDNGNLVSNTNSVRLKNPINLTDSRFSVTHTFTFGHQQNLPGSYNIYFYKTDGTFLSSLKNQTVRQFIQIPTEAASMRVTFSAANLSNGYVELWSWKPSNNITVKNSEFAFNRRQGITVGGGENVLIENNKLHDQKGTDPQSGIDLEGGDFVLNNNINIKNNDFYNNQRYDVILYDGKNTTVEQNHLGSKGAIGLAVSTPFNGATIKNNFFDGSSIYAYHDVTFIGNKMNGSLTHIEGPRVSIDGMQFDNGAIFSVSPTVPYGVSISNVTLNNSSFANNVNPVHVTNMTLNGGSFGGSVAGNTYDNLKVLNSSGSGISPGTYNNCIFETVVANNGPHTSTDGVYNFNNCTFKGAGPGFNGKNTDVTIKNSIFEQAGFTIAYAKNVDLENNTFNMNLAHNDLFKPSVIMIGGYWTKGSPYGVMKATIKGNTITSNDNAGGISTIFAGTDAPSYDIENNILYNAKLLLNPVDINISNKELTK